MAATFENARRMSSSSGIDNHSYRDVLDTYWQQQVAKLESEEQDRKIHQLPLARIKVMDANPEIKMISAEAPTLFAKGCDIFITELTMRAWIHAEENKRRTLQRTDIASTLSKSDMLEFLIDIVPQEEVPGKSNDFQSEVGNVELDPKIDERFHQPCHLRKGRTWSRGESACNNLMAIGELAC